MRSGLWSLLALPLAAVATDPSPRFEPLRPLRACLDPGQARSFRLLDSRHLLVDAGRRHFLLELGWRCPALTTARQLQFDGRNPGMRICGDLGDAVHAFGRAPRGLDRCPVARVVPLSAEEAAAELRAGPSGAARPVD